MSTPKVGSRSACSARFQPSHVFSDVARTAQQGASCKLTTHAYLCAGKAPSFGKTAAQPGSLPPEELAALIAALRAVPPLATPVFDATHAAMVNTVNVSSDAAVDLMDTLERLPYAQAVACAFKSLLFSHRDVRLHKLQCWALGRRITALAAAAQAALPTALEQSGTLESQPFWCAGSTVCHAPALTCFLRCAWPACTCMHANRSCSA